MNPDDILKFVRRAKSKARRDHMGHEADDFGSYVTVRLLEGSTSNVNQMWTDYLRINYGDNRKKHKSGQQRIHTDEVHPSMAVTSPINLDFGFIQRFLSENGEWVSQRDRCVMTLKYQWAMSDQEIGDALGVSSRMVVYILREIEGRLETYLRSEFEGSV